MVTHSRGSRTTALVRDANEGENLPLVSDHPPFYKEAHLQNLFSLAVQGPWLWVLPPEIEWLPEE